MTSRTSGARSGRTARTDRSDTSAKATPDSAAHEAHDVYCWGFGGRGALGNGAFRDELAPYLVAELREHGGSLLVCCGFDHTIAVTGDLKARGWGRCSEGQLDVQPDEAIEAANGMRSVVLPKLLDVCSGEAAFSVQAVGAGGMHTGVITLPRVMGVQPEVFMFGRNAEGQLGEDGGEESCDNVSISLPVDATPTSIACGGLHSAMVSELGQLYTWGGGSFGQLGLGTRQGHSRPRRLPSVAWEGRAEKERPRRLVVSAADEGGATFHVRGQRGAPLQVACISCGSYHTAAATVEGELFSWGANGAGQLGMRDFIDRGSPHLVGSLQGVLQVACGGKHTLALLQDGIGWSCGDNTSQQLGRLAGERDPAFDEVELGNASLVQVAAGGAHSAAVSSNGCCYTWGKNQNGQLGHGHTNRVDCPEAVTTLDRRVLWVSCGGAHTAALVQLPE